MGHTIIHDAIQNIAALVFKSGGCHVVNKPVMEDLEGKSLIADHMVIGNGTHDGRRFWTDRPFRLYETPNQRQQRKECKI